MNIKDTFSSLEKEELFPGVWVYRNIIKKDLNIIDRIEKVINQNTDKVSLQWQEATVGYKQKMPEYRDCVDFKMKKLDYPGKDDVTLEIDEIWQDVYDAQVVAVQDYCAMFNIEMNYWEAMNVIKYGPGQHFQEHADHGWSYIATVSLVAYLNDDYEEGGLSFGKIGLNIKPKAGDLYIFPSTFLFSHRAMPVKSGTKYSIVTMLDYNEKAHTPAYHNA
jgi:hypothetical protein